MLIDGKMYRLPDLDRNLQPGLAHFFRNSSSRPVLLNALFARSATMERVSTSINKTFAHSYYEGAFRFGVKGSIRENKGYGRKTDP